MTPLPSGIRCRHRHSATVLIRLVTEFTANAVRIATTADVLCVRWALPPDALDVAVWPLFEADVLSEALGPGR